MTQVRCLYCGGSLSADSEHCPHCGAPSHFRRRGLARTTRLRFLVFVALLAAFMLVMIVWLPR